MKNECKAPIFIQKYPVMKMPQQHLHTADDHKPHE